MLSHIEKYLFFKPEVWMRRVVWIYISASIFHVWLNEDSWILISASAVSCAKLFSFFPLSSLRVCLLCHSFLALVSAEKLADDLTGVLWHVICHFSLVSFNILSWSLIFVSLMTVCLRVFLLEFILPGTLCASWIWLTVFVPTLGKFSAIISSNILSGPFSPPLLRPL